MASLARETTLRIGGRKIFFLSRLGRMSVFASHSWDRRRCGQSLMILTLTFSYWERHLELSRALE
jgi:hypothetical protein